MYTSSTVLELAGPIKTSTAVRSSSEHSRDSLEVTCAMVGLRNLKHPPKSVRSASRRKDLQCSWPTGDDIPHETPSTLIISSCLLHTHCGNQLYQSMGPGWERALSWFRHTTPQGLSGSWIVDAMLTRGGISIHPSTIPASARPGLEHRTYSSADAP